MDLNPQRRALVGSLDGRTVVITGAAGGLGRAYTLLFAREGARIVATDVPHGQEPLDRPAEEVDQLGGQIVPRIGDVSDEHSANETVACAVDAFGGLDVLVNNAGTFLEKAILDTSAAEWDAQARVHLRGHFLMTRAAGRHWREVRRAGGDVAASVVNTTSRSALNAIEGHGSYAAAKAGIITFTEITAKEFGPLGVRANCVAPFARTAMTRTIPALAGAMPPPEASDAFDPFAPANVAPLVAYLATRECRVTGQVLFCHGGVVQRYHPWSPGEMLERDTAWTVGGLAACAAILAHDGAR
jgi:NAD(P)-dependent dehydrogenase (short-subunit alcohol dehydrogenase family)